MRRRGLTDEAIERALDELTAAGYLSDARYAQAVVAQRKGRFGKRAIVHTLTLHAESSQIQEGDQHGHFGGVLRHTRPSC